MDVLLIGGGGREHAIAWKLRQSPRLGALTVAPGNGGIAQIADCAPLAIPKPYAAAAEVRAFGDAVLALARDRHADLVIVAPDDPLALGLVDIARAAGLRAFGPTRAAARIESSKAFAKELMQRHGIPMGASARFDTFEAARAYVESRACEVVVKADGLAAGKGTTVAATHEEAVAALRSLMVEGTLGEAGRAVVVEDRLTGPETSAHAFTDGRSIAQMPFSCDHKAAYDDNRGPNTGGMGAYSPAVWLAEATADAIRRDVTEATVRAMAAEGTPFEGVLYPGLMVTQDGPRVIEFNARFGDPETQVLLPRLETDLLDVMLAVTDRTLDRIDLRWSARAAVTVVLASGGYPGVYETGKVIEGLDDLDADVLAFHAGTRRSADGRTVTAGGRVLAITALGDTMADARARAYDNVARIRFEGMHYRRDIGASEVRVEA